MNRTERNSRIQQLWPAIQAKASYLAAKYRNPEPADIANEMALTILERAEAEPTFLTENNQTYILRFAAWRWQDAQRHEGYHARAASLDAETAAGASLGDLLPDTTPIPDELVVAGGRSSALRQALAALPDALRDTVLAFYGAGLSGAQVAELVGRPAGTVRYQLHVARQQLAAELVGF